MRIVAIGDRITVDAMKLMGVAGRVVENAEEAKAALVEAREPETVILISPEAVEMVREEVDELRGARRDFIVIELPGAGGPTQAEETARLVSQAVGIKI